MLAKTRSTLSDGVLSPATARSVAAPAATATLGIVAGAHDHRSRRLAALLIASLVLSAGFVALSADLGRYHWLALLGLLPLFFLIHRAAALCALLSGALLGACLFAFTATGLGPPIEVGIGSALLFTSVPAVYACFGALLTRWIGFSPFVLGVGWVGVELAFSTSGLGMGLLGATQSGGPLIQHVGRALGYVLVAFVVAYINAAIVSVIECVRVAIPRPHPTTASVGSQSRVEPQAVLSLLAFSLHPS